MASKPRFDNLMNALKKNNIKIFLRQKFFAHQRRS
jgi:hypothetical protein